MQRPIMTLAVDLPDASETSLRAPIVKCRPRVRPTAETNRTRGFASQRRVSGVMVAVLSMFYRCDVQQMKLSSIVQASEQYRTKPPSHANGRVSRAASRSWSYPLHCSTCRACTYSTRTSAMLERSSVCHLLSSSWGEPPVFGGRLSSARKKRFASGCSTKAASGALRAVSFAQQAGGTS